MRGPDMVFFCVFLNYDEHGGLYALIPPPAAILPD